MRSGKLRFRALAAAGALLLVLAACQPGGAPKTSAELAAESLERGVQAQNAARFDDALVAYFETLSRDPKNKFAFFNLGQMYRNQQKCPIAEGYYRQAVEIDPNVAGAWFGIGFCRLAVAAWEEARDANDRVVKLEPNNASGHFNLALALRQLGRESEAQAEFQRAAQLDANLRAPATPSPSGTRRP